MSLEGLFGLPQVNNSNKGDGAMMKEIVKGTFDSAGVATVYTQLTKIEYHTLGYVFNGARQADAINVEQVSSGTCLVYGVASKKFAGELCGRAIYQE